MLFYVRFGNLDRNGSFPNVGLQDPWIMTPKSHTRKKSMFDNRQKIVNAWRDLEYFETLTAEEKENLPKNPAGKVKLFLVENHFRNNHGTSISPGGTCDTSISPDSCCSSTPEPPRTSISPGGTCDTSISPGSCCE